MNFATFATFKMPKPQPIFFSYRQYHKINIEAFKSENVSSELIQNQAKTTSALSSQFNKVLTDLIDKHAPLKNMSQDLNGLTKMGSWQSKLNVALNVSGKKPKLVIIIIIIFISYIAR